MGKRAKSTSALGIELGMTAAPADDPKAAGLVYVDMAVIIKDLDLQGGQKDEHEVTTFASEAKEYEGGLSDSGTVSMSGNWKQGDEAHEALLTADDDSQLRAFKIKHKDGSVGRFLAFVKQYTYKAVAGGTIAATWQLRVSGKVYWEVAVA